MFQIGTGDSQPKFRIKNLSSNGTYWPFCGSGPRFGGRIQWPPATNPRATGTTPASACDLRSSRQARKRKICSCRWPRRGGDWPNKPRARESRTPIELVALIRNEPAGYSQQHSTGPGRQSPKISVPTPDDRRCRRGIFWISYSWSGSYFGILDKHRIIVVSLRCDLGARSPQSYLGTATNGDKNHRRLCIM